MSMPNSEDRLTTGARLYISAVIAAGIAAVSHSLYVLISGPVTYHWFILAGLTLLSGSFTVRIPTIPARLSVSETFVFATVLLFGSAAATIIVVLDSLIISLWLGQRSRRPSRVLFNRAAPSVAIWIAANVFYWLAGIGPLSSAPRAILSLIVPLLVLAVLYFLLNSFLIAWAVAFEKRVSALTVWRQNFMWLSLNYFSGASVAALLLPYLQADYDDFAKVLGVLLPLLLISYLTFKTALGRVDDANRHLSELNRLYLSTIETLAMAIDAKDQITHGHIRRVQIYAVGLAKAVGVTDSAQIRAIEAAALLHDMGKLAVPEYILNKPGPLTPAEFEKMKMHASVGADILSSIDFPYPVVPIVRHHHESWDGSGYPDGLAGADIPIGARVLSVVDCFDALTSDRPYRPRLSDSDAIKILLERRGRMYDPLVVDTFIRVHAQISPDTQQACHLSSSFVAITEAALPTTHNPAGQKSLEDISASTEEMLALFNLSLGLSAQLGLGAVAEGILRHLRRLVPFSSAVVYIHDRETGELVATYASGEHAGLLGGMRIPLGQRLSGWVAAHRQTIRNSDPMLDFGDITRSLSPRPKSSLSTPLTVREDLVGVLTLYSVTRDVFSDDHQRVLELVAAQFAAVVERAVTVDNKNPNYARRDHLAGLHDHEQLRQFAKEHSSDSGAQAYFSIIHLQLEDRPGRSDGPAETDEKALNELAGIAKRHMRSTDALFRYADVELVIALPHTPSSIAAGIAASIKEVAAKSFGEQAVSSVPDISVAIAAAPEQGASVDALILAAKHKAGMSKLPGIGRQSPKSIH